MKHFIFAWILLLFVPFYAEAESSLLNHSQTQLDPAAFTQPNTPPPLVLNDTSLRQLTQGYYPVWVSPELEIRSLAAKDLQAALQRKFTDSIIYSLFFPAQIAYLQTHADQTGLPDSCTNLQALIDQHQIVDDGYDIHSNTLPKVLTQHLFLAKIQSDCQAIRLLRYIHAAKSSHMNDVAIDENFFDELPVFTFPDFGMCTNGTAQGEDAFQIPPYQFKKGHQVLSWNEFIKNSQDPDLSESTTNNGSTEVLFNFTNPFHIRITNTDLGLGNPPDTTVYLLAKGSWSKNNEDAMLVEIVSTIVNDGLFDINGPYTRSIDFGGLFILTRAPNEKVFTLQFPQRYGFSLGQQARSVACDARFNWLLSSRKVL